MSSLLNRVKQAVASAPGTGGVLLGTAVPPYQTLAAAGADGVQYSYMLEDIAAGKYEVGRGTYTAATNSFSRDTVLDSSAGYGVAETFGSAVLFAVVLLKQDLDDMIANAASTATGLALVFGA